jgi:hypothetical protein
MIIKLIKKKKVWVNEIDPILRNILNMLRCSFVGVVVVFNTEWMSVYILIKLIIDAK